MNSILFNFLLLSFLIVSGCSKKSDFYKKSDVLSEVIVSPPITPPTEEPPIDEPKQEDPKQIALECSKAVTDGLIKEQSYDLNFESVYNCDWGVNGNVALKNSQNCILGARVEVKKSIALPANAQRICDLKFNFSNTNLKFDDEMMITLNDIVILSSQDFSSSKIDDPKFRLPKDEQGLIRYSWLNMAMSPYYKKNACAKSNKYIEHYCLGYTYNTPEYAANCIMPPTEVAGPLIVNIPQETIFKLSSVLGFEFDKNYELGKEKNLSLSLNSFGDNDSGDCSQNGAHLKVTVKYIED